MQNLLFLHGAIGSKSQFDDLTLHLNESYTIHVLNFNGHGGEPFYGNFSIEQFAVEVLDYLKMNSIDSIHIFGYSMGGYVALYLAKYHSEKINKIFTLGTKFHWNPEIANREIKMLNAEKIAEKVPAFAKELEQRHQPNDWKVVLIKTAEMMIAIGNKNPLSLTDFSTIKLPVSINIGENDTMVTLEETQAAYKALANSKFYIFPQTPHPIEKVNVEKLAAAIKDFFG